MDGRSTFEAREFLAHLRNLTRAVPRGRPAEAIVVNGPHGLVLKTVDGVGDLACTGDWRGQALLPSGAVRALRRMRPKPSERIGTLQDDRLSIGSFSLGLTALPPERIGAPRFSFQGNIGLLLRHASERTAAQIAEEGLTVAVGAAQERLERCVVETTHALRELHVPKAVVRRFLLQHVAHATGDPPPDVRYLQYLVTAHKRLAPLGVGFEEFHRFLDAYIRHPTAG